jgi:hypothetical protein
VTEATAVNPARQILETMLADADNIENLTALYSMKGRPEEVRLALTRSTSALWVLGALDYARWHLFSLLTAIRAIKSQATDEDLAYAEHLKKEGRLA